MLYSRTSSVGLNDEFTADCRKARERVLAWAETLAQACEYKVLFEDIEYVREWWLKEADEKIAESGTLWEVELRKLREYLRD